jgi:hypothetical protein
VEWSSGIRDMTVRDNNEDRNLSPLFLVSSAFSLGCSLLLLF